MDTIVSINNTKTWNYKKTEYLGIVVDKDCIMNETGRFKFVECVITKEAIKRKK